MSIIAVYREPFSFEPQVRYLPEGTTLAAMAGAMRGLPDDFGRRGAICINGHPVPRASWPLIRPKPSVAGVPVEVTFHAPIMGGGGEDGGKNTFAIIAGIALTIATGFVTGGGLTKLGFGAIFGQGKIGAILAGAAVSYVGSLLIASLSPPPSVPERENIERLGNASAAGNVLQPNAAIPRVVGTRKIFPPLAMEPLIYFDGDDEVVEAIYALAGPHALTDIRINDAPIDDLIDVESETREGWIGDERIDLIERYARTEQIQNEIRGHSVTESNGKKLESQSGALSDALPQLRTLVTREEPDEYQIQFAFPGGLNKDAASGTKIRVPIRLQMREVGEATWINLPELHFQASSLRGLRATIRLVWSESPQPTQTAASAEGFVEARINAPGQTVEPAGSDYDANSYFDDGSGADYMDASNLGTNAVANVEMGHYEATIHLDTGTFPKGRYEVRIQRGYAFEKSNYTASSYTFNGSARDFFAYENTSNPQIRQSRDGITDTMVLVRAASIWNAHPAQTDECAFIALRARNRSVDRLSVVASGYVRDLASGAWNNWTTTSNPAPHLRDIIGGMLCAKPIPAAMIDDLSTFRTRCIDEGHAVNAILEDKSVAEAARIVASAGYGRLRMSETWGVVEDYNRNTETPVQVFSPRNMANFQWSKAFRDPPDAFLVSFADVDREYDERQLPVYRDGSTGKLMEQVTYEGLVTEAAVRKRARYDFRNARFRSAFYTLEAPAEAIRCRRGSLVGVVHDMLTRHSGQGRIVDWTETDAGVTSITLDDTVTMFNDSGVEAVTDMEAVTDFEGLGKTTGIAIRRTDGTITTHAVSNAAGETDTLTFASAISATGIEIDALVTVGEIEQEYGRFVVFGIEPKDEMTFTITLVDEGAAIHEPTGTLTFNGTPLAFDGAYLAFNA